MRVKITKLYGQIEKINETINDIDQGRVSQTDGPIKVSRLDAPRGCFFMIDGYHRVLEAISNKETTIEWIICEDVPRIERTAGAFNGILENKVQITSYLLSLSKRD